MFQTAMLVLLYNKEIVDSGTLNSLIKLSKQCPSIKLVIWNNGPKKLANRDCLQFEALGYDVEIKETLHNESLAVIYNRFIAMNQADKYIILDDDSELNDEYLLAVLKCGAAEVAMPKITSAGIVRSPTIDYIPYIEYSTFNSKNLVLGIGSGLVIGEHITNTLKENYSDIFDERFYLYGVDFTFCRRLFDCKLTDKIKVIPGFEHSLSRLAEEDVKITRFRRLERSYDLGLTLRYYFPLPTAVFKLFKVFIKIYILRRMAKVNFGTVIKAFLTGIHYRNN
ncbi:hypothetical protein [Algibacillus agarilyticus]|uniref:hypothetical protein n=1 Tax=Algibacillus agarilyticus TaxID=2234133 RepID=UPI000DD0E4BF|nr:hypothetical protein [Algibacillus agarilyticus]